MKLMVNDKIGGAPAVTTQEAYDAVWAAKGFRLLSDEEAAALDAQRLRDETPGIEQLVTPLAEAQVTGDPAGLTSAYEAMTKDALRDLAESRELDGSGNKAEIVARLVDADVSGA